MQTFITSVSFLQQYFTSFYWTSPAPQTPPNKCKNETHSVDDRHLTNDSNSSSSSQQRPHSFSNLSALDRARILKQASPLGVRYEPVEYAPPRALHKLGMQENDAYMMTRLGEMCENGEVASPNKVEALKWFQRAADTGNARAMRILGDKYVQGKIVERSLTNALLWYGKAAEKGCEEAKTKLEGFKFLQKEIETVAAKEKNQGSMYFQFGELCEKYGVSVGLDKSEAIKWYIKAAAFSETRAMFKLAQAYESGTYVEVSLYKAAQLYKQLAEREVCATGDPQNLFMFARSYANIVGDNSTEALRWYRIASERGCARATCALAFKCIADNDPVTAFNHIKNAVQQDPTDGYAKHILASFYEDGVGGQTDTQKAKNLYYEALGLGWKDAKAGVTRLSKWSCTLV